MDNQKIENLLNISLHTSEEERAESAVLQVGYDAQTRQWDLIVKYSGDLKRTAADFAKIVELQNGYAIVTIREDYIERLAALDEVEYIEKPKRLSAAVNLGINVSCITSVRRNIANIGFPLYGEGVIIACIDSGIDYTHPDFRNEDGSSRILYIWDQEGNGTPPNGYERGAEYTQQQINDALNQTSSESRRSLVPTLDLSGHGTSVAGIAAGNGRASGGVNLGAAPASSLIIVKLGLADRDGFHRTTELMQAIDYVIRKGISLKMPLVINLSFGSNYGNHDGDSLLEQYIDSIATIGKTVICVGSGNEGGGGIHTGGTLVQNQTIDIPFSISPYETGLSLQIWKHFLDNIILSIITPSGRKIELFETAEIFNRFETDGMRILSYYGTPTPYSMSQEIFIDFIPLGLYLNSGLWYIRLEALEILNGQYDLWMPSKGSLNAQTRFYYPTEETTLTIPSTAHKVITVGAYDYRYDNYASFSGRGPTRTWKHVKPDLAAPGVDILTTAVGGGYDSMSGTSFATPFVTGSAALLMEWGIVKGNDPYLYGEKLKAHLLKSARRNDFLTYPNPQTGWGMLCLDNFF